MTSGCRLFKLLLFSPTLSPGVCSRPSKYMCAKSLQSCLTLCNPMDCTLPGSSFHGFSREEYWSVLPLSSPGDSPDPGIKHASLTSPALAGVFFTSRATWEAPEIRLLSLENPRDGVLLSRLQL